MTTTTKKKTKAELLEDLSVERELTDLEFLEAVVADLDSGWITGAMCDSTGKCLVGAGAAALGLNYHDVFAGNNVIINEFDPDFTEEFSQKVSDKEWKSAKRFIDLIGDDMSMTRWRIEQTFGVPLEEISTGSVVAIVTTFNDSDTPDYLALRRILTNKIEELRK